MPTGKESSKNKEKKAVKVPYHHKPDGMSIDAWQRALRRQFAETQNFTMKNIGSHGTNLLILAAMNLLTEIG